MARLGASFSKDPSTQVGSIIVDSKRRFVSSGYNGFPQRVNDLPERLVDRLIKYPITLHAELNAILFSSKSLDDCTLYVWPIPPCAACAAAIIQTGIARVVAAIPDEGTPERWVELTDLAQAILKEAGVSFTTYRESEIEPER